MRSNSMRIRIFVFAALLLVAVAAAAQQHPNVKKGFNVDSVYQLGDLDHVNTFNGNLVVQIPLSGTYQVGGDLSYSLSLTYNSKVWDYESAGGLSPLEKPYVKVIPTRRSNAGLGWLLSLGRILDIDHPANKSEGLVYESPDGSEHRIWCTLHPNEDPPYFCSDEITQKVNDPNQVQGYTRDGTYIRMRWLSEQQAAIEFPDGSSHVFEDDPDATKRSMRIVEMRDRFNNKVRIEYPDAKTWKITDTSSTDPNKKRTHFVRFEDTPQADQQNELNYKTRVRTVEIAKFDTSERAVYTFVYDDIGSTKRGCVSDEFELEPTGEPRPPRLRTIVLPIAPAGSTVYTFGYHDADPRTCSSGALETMSTPTGGAYLYEYMRYRMPNYKCDGTAVLNETPGVARRTLTDPARGTNNPAVWIYATELAGTRTEICKASTTWASNTYTHPTLKNTTTLPSKEKVVRYFSVWPKQDDPKIKYRRHEYGLPINRDEELEDVAGQVYYLSTETYGSDNQLKMQTYVAYELDPKPNDHPWEPATWDRNRRVQALATAYRDDIVNVSQNRPRTTVTRHGSFDGLGHYREVVTGGNFSGANGRTMVTNYNPGKALPTGSNPTLPHENTEWLLETYTSQKITENGKTLKTEFCFNPVTGFLDARRTLKDDSTDPQPGVNDTLVKFVETSGNITSERYFGGDGNRKTSASGCNPGNENPQYEIKHGYQFGVRNTTEHVGSGFLSLDNDIDPYSGLVKRSRDSAKIFTDFTYDVLGRIKTSKPESGHGASFDYTYAFNSSRKWSTVDVKAFGSDNSVIDRRFVTFDGLGRVFRTFDLMPSDNPSTTTWSLTQTDYDGMNRRSIVYQPEKVTTSDPNNYTGSPLNKTLYSYDYLGRVTTLTPPDGEAHKVTYTYNGIGIVTESVRRANVDQTTAERATTVVKNYDRFGRIHSVTQNAKDTSATDLDGNPVTTTYTYDPADRLLTVDADGVQDRTFVYDGRGFLTSETHPESGVTSYEGYDARGHATTRKNGGNTLTFEHDPAERLEKVTDQNNRVIKEFIFGKANDGSARGKLLKAIRRNDTQSIGRVDVTETYAYNGKGGQVSNRTTLVEKVDGGGGRDTIQTFNYFINSYDDLLLPKQISMPTCSGCNVPEDAISSVTNMRTAGHLTSVKDFASMGYHPTGMVSDVTHATAGAPVDEYGEKHGIARVSKVAFTPCGSDQPFFPPDPVIVKVNADPNACGLHISWPAAVTCGGVSNMKYSVYKGDDKIASCLNEDHRFFIDDDVQPNDRPVYKIVAEGPKTDGGTGACQDGRTTEKFSQPFLFNNCNYETFLHVEGVGTASIGVPSTFKASLSSANGPLQNEEVRFYINNDFVVSRRTSSTGQILFQHTVELDPGNYEIRAEFAGSVAAPRKTAINSITALCDSRSYSVFPLSFNILASGGPLGVVMNTSPRCGWLPKLYPELNPDNFLTVDKTTESKGNGSFTITAASANTGVNRTGVVGVGLQNVRVEQGSGCTYRFSPQVAYVPAFTSAETSIDISVPPSNTCDWEVKQDEDSKAWLTLKKDSGVAANPNDNYITFTVRNNGQYGDKKRKAHLYIEKDGTRYDAWVNQQAPPEPECLKLVTDIQGGSVRDGQNITMRAWVTGNYITYTWYRNGLKWRECEGDNCANVTIGPGQNGYVEEGEPSATFVLHARNICNEVVTSTVTWSNSGQACRVPMLSTSTFGTNQWPSDQNAASPGARVRMRVFVDGPATEYKWYQGFADDRSDEIPSLKDQGLGLDDEAEVRPTGDAAFYWVDVQNNCGWNQSRTAMIQVTPPPKRPAVGHMSFNNDNKADVMWRNSATGANEMWVSGTNGYTTVPMQPNTNLDAQMQTVGDLNGDEDPDMLWRDPKTGANQVWTMNGLSRTGVTNLEGRAGGGWAMGAVGDFDDDENHDIVWHDSATGANEIWFQDGTEHEGTWALPPSSGGLHGAGDFNLDGKPDLFFYDRSTQVSSIWLMDEAQQGTVRSFSTDPTGGVNKRRQLSVKSEAVIAATQQTDPNLVPVLVGDMDGDQWPDIVWRDTVTGANKVWKMLATNVTSTFEITPRPDLTWQPGGGGTNGGDGSGGPTTGGPTTMTVTAGPAAFGTAAPVTATLTSGTTPLAGRTVVFKLNGAEKTRLLTGSDGIAAAAISVSGLAAGTYPNAITATFEGDTSYSTSTASTNLVINAQPAVVTWSNPAPIVYGTPLSAVQLNATADAAGTFVYDPPAGTILGAGFRTLSVTFTPSNTAIAPVTVQAVIVVNKATSSVTWPKPAAIAYGTPLGATQLNATSSLPGTFTYQPEAGTALPVGNGQTLSVTFEPDETNYAGSSATTTIDVEKGRQLIRWQDPAPITVLQPLTAAQLNATVNASGSAPAGQLTYTPPAGTTLPPGVHELRVNAAATAEYEAASATVDLVVTNVKATLTWATPAPIVYGTPLSSAQLNATADVAGTFTYSHEAGTVLGAGTTTLYVTFKPADSRYEEVTAAVDIDVAKAQQTIVWSKPAGIVYGTPLSSAQLNAQVQVVGPALPGNLVYTPQIDTVLPAGTHTLTVTADPTNNYASATASVTIDVAKATPIITWPAPASIVYGTALTATQLNAEVTVVGPSAAGALVYTPPAGRVLDAGNHTLTVNALETSNYEPATLSVSLEVRRKALSLVVDPKSKLYGGVVPVLTGTLTGVVNNDPITPSYATTGTQQSPAGTYPISGALVDPNSRLPNYDVTITPSTMTVLPAPLTIAANPASKQYSDPVPTLTATYIGFVLGETPAILSGTLVIQTTGEPLSEPGTYPISIGGLTSPNYAITYAGSTLTVTQEDARVLITAPLSLSAAKSGATTVTMTATVQDISATADAAGDTFPGDIRKATLTFINRTTGETLCTGPIGLVSAADQRTGTAICNFARDFGTTLPASMTVGAVVGGYYTRNPTAEDVSLTVSAQTPDQVVGAGAVSVATAAGTHAPDLGTEAKFTILSMYDTDGVAKGHFTFNFTRTDGGTSRKYELSAVTMTSLSIARNNPGGTAVIVGTGTLVDTTNRITVAEGVPIFITATDAPSNKVNDELTVIALRTDGGVWLAAGWNGVKPVQQPIANGQIQVVEKK